MSFPMTKESCEGLSDAAYCVEPRLSTFHCLRRDRGRQQTDKALPKQQQIDEHAPWQAICVLIHRCSGLRMTE